MGRDPPHHHLSSHGELPLAEEDVVKMRSRIADMGLSSEPALPSLSSKEQELGGMVTRLLDAFIDPSQLLLQAEFITWLGSQRDLLVRSFEEERQRWEAEREGWNRMAEALLAQQAKTGTTASGREEQVENQHSVCESENKALREKVQDYQLRYSALESELNRLKPLLLMQPPMTSSSTERLFNSKSSKPKRKTVDSSSSGERANINDLSQPDDSLHNTPRSEYYRHHSQSRSSFLTPLLSRSAAQTTPMRSVFSVPQTPSTHATSSKRSKYKTKKSHHSNLLPLSADARTELLLIAARKIGRERANMISGFMRRIEKERESEMQERDAERLDREKESSGVGHAYYRKDATDLETDPSSVASSSAHSMPKTPKRGNAEGKSTTHFLTPTTLMTPRSNLYPQSNNGPSSFVFVGSPPITSYQNSVFTPRPTSHAQTKTTRRASATPATHPTPLASLLSAAKSMMDDESNEPSPNSNNRRRTGAAEPPDSPIPKRRRVGNGNTSGSRGKVDMLAAASTLGTDRVRSALDVLADQAAAAFDSDRQSPGRSTARVTTRSRGRDRGYNATCPPVVSDEDTHDDSTPKGRVWSVERASPGLVGTGSPIPTRSRSRAMLTDRLAKGTLRSQQKKKDKSSGIILPGGAHNAPRMIFSPVLRSPTLPLSPSPTAATLPSVSVEGGDESDRTGVVDMASRSQKSFLDDDDLASSNGASDHMVSLGVGNDQPRDRGSVDPEGAYVSSSRSLVASDNETEDKEETSESGNRLPVFHKDIVGSAVDDSHGGEESASVESTPVGEGTKDVMMEELGAPSHIVHGGSPDEAYDDTDADAEGEMDVEAEETVFMDLSSMAHAPVGSIYSLKTSDAREQSGVGLGSRGNGPTES